MPFQGDTKTLECKSLVKDTALSQNIVRTKTRSYPFGKMVGSVLDK